MKKGTKSDPRYLKILAYQRQYYADHKKEMRALHRWRWKTFYKTKHISHKTWLSRVFAEIKYRAKQRNIPFTLVKNDITTFPSHCPIFGAKLDYQRGHKGGKYRDNSASIDRIDSSKAYATNNVQIVSYRANVLKNEATLSELIVLGEWAIKQREKTSDV